MSSGLVNSAAPIPPLIENDFGQPILISTAATSLHLKQKTLCQNGFNILVQADKGLSSYCQFPSTFYT